MNISRRNIGVNRISDSVVEIRVWAPEAEKVELQTDRTKVDLIPEKTGYWSAQSTALKEGDDYWLVLNGVHRLPDPASLWQPEGVHGPSRFLDLSFNWHDENYCNPALQEYIFYELHTATFSERGDFRGIAERLEHLQQLGITAIEIMPVAAFPGERNWGYDGVFPFAVQHSYGGAVELQYLVDQCHQRGIAVVLDVVYNHIGPEGNYLPQFGAYFTEKYQTPWGAAVNYDDCFADGVRDFVVDNVLMWFRDFHIDALRLDAVHAIKDFSAVHILQEIRKATDQLMEFTGRRHYLIAESDLNDPRYISPLGENGLGMDAQWTDEFHHSLRVTAGEPKKGYYADFRPVSDLAKAYTDAYVYTGAYSPERKKKFGRKAEGHSGSQFVVYAQNHDQIGNRMRGSRATVLYSNEMQKLLAGAILLSPFLPLLFMGEEWGETNPFLYFVSHTDPELVAMVRSGRKAEFAAMHVDGEAPDPQEESTFQASRIDWEKLAADNHQTRFNFYQALIALRKGFLPLSSGEKKMTRCQAFPDRYGLLLERGISGSAELACCLMNFSTQPQQLPIPANIKLVRQLFNSSENRWADPGHSDLNTTADGIIHLQPESFIVYQAIYV